MSELLEALPFNLISVGLLGALALRRLVLMERFHWLRVVILTALLWVPVIYLFTFAFPSSPTCEPDLKEPGRFTIHARLDRRSRDARVSL
jgi:hypothetical protein